jgi:uncharacterized protein YcsI (UPF0317 family)
MINRVEEYGVRVRQSGVAMRYLESPTATVLYINADNCTNEGLLSTQINVSQRNRANREISAMRSQTLTHTA